MYVSERVFFFFIDIVIYVNKTICFNFNVMHNYNVLINSVCVCVCMYAALLVISYAHVTAPCTYYYAYLPITAKIFGNIFFLNKKLLQTNILIIYDSCSTKYTHQPPK